MFKLQNVNYRRGRFTLISQSLESGIWILFLTLYVNMDQSITTYCSTLEACENLSPSVSGIFFYNLLKFQLRFGGVLIL